MKRMICLVSLFVFMISTSAQAKVACVRQRATTGAISEGTSIKIRSICKPNEIQFDPVDLGLQGPVGPRGEQGPPGPVYGNVPCATSDGSEVFFTGCNVHIVNGLGSTWTKNGTGNLIIGYNEDTGPDHYKWRSGSHNLVIGDGHNYSSHSGIVSGRANTIKYVFSSITGGFFNRGGRVLGGQYNNANPGTTVNGGEENFAGAGTICGGELNNTAAPGSSILGGLSQQTTIEYQTIPALP